jgi:phage terminase large subunit GpA-like protein
MVDAGRWRATRPHVKGHAGFKTSALISTLANAAWPEIVREFLEAKKDPDLLRVWTNTLMGEPFHDRSGDGFDEHELAKRAESFGLADIPADVRVITAGVDVQAYGLEIVTLGHSATQMFVMGYETIHGAPTADETWRELDDLLKRRFPHPLGGAIGYDAAAVDSGNDTDIIYSYTKPRASRRIVSIKGHDGDRPLIEKSTKPWLYIVGADACKSRLYGLLERAGHVRFSAELPPRFYAELTSERRVTFYKAGQPRRRWERIKGARAEALDGIVYAMAVRQLVGVDLTRRENELREIVKPGAAQAVYRSKFMQGERG